MKVFLIFSAGWADTPAVRSSMPDFYNKMKDKLRTVEQGADTVVWLAMADAAVTDEKNKGGQFFQVNSFLMAPSIALISVFLPHKWCC